MLFTEGSQLLLINVTGVYVRPNRDEVEPRRLFANRRCLLADQWACFGNAAAPATVQRAVSV